jgi:hypothetical protein
MGKITNITGVSLPLAVWLASDDYDFTPGDKSISATSLLKTPRQIILSSRLTPETAKVPDVSDYIASRLGHSIHDGIEKAWTRNPQNILRNLGYPEKLAERIVINPDKIEDNQIPVWLEHRGQKTIDGYDISGKFDMVIDGQLYDFKSTSVYSYISGSKDEDYKLQGSIYRWIHQDKITDDYINIQFIFTDWSSAQSKQSEAYPKQRVMEYPVQLMSLEATEAWIRDRIRNLERYQDASETELPFCSDKDLWRGETVYKYYSDPAKAQDPKARASKNFTNLHEAKAYEASKGKGIVVTFPGKVKACAYCRAAPICTQKDLYEHA